MRWMIGCAIALLMGCQARVDHGGQVDHVFTLDVEQLEYYFTAVCEKEVDPEIVEACVAYKIGEFLDVLSSMQNNGKGPK